MAKCVLVVEDDKLICWALEKEFSSRGLVVDEAACGKDALEKVQRTFYQLAFVDLHLPDCDGVELLGPLREICPETRVVILGCEARLDKKQIAFASGAWQYVEKPFELSDIVGLANRIFGGHAEKRDQERYLCRLPIRVTLVSHAAKDAALDLRNLSATAVEVGDGGMRLRTSYPLRIGQRVRTESLSADDPCARFLHPESPSEVVWCRPGDREFEAGLRYLQGPTPARTS